jgi:hypothetical protein
MKKIVLIAMAACAVASPALAKRGDRVGGPHAGGPVIPSSLMQELGRIGFSEPLGRAGGGSQRMANQNIARCVTDRDGNKFFVTAVYRFNALAGEYRLDRRSVTATAGCTGQPA